MYGLEAISAYNGWAMAITGPLIVMSGLAILSLIISQLHKVVAVFDKKDKQATEPAVQSKDEISVPKVLPIDISETAEIYQQLIDKLEQPFELSDLYRVAEENNFPHPVLTISRFREAGILKQADEGVFIWNR
ncbi:MAG: OadG family protein [Desulfobacteraceae bacterium]|nr:OadG family protein [Desulfobacteraceae bacterium]